MAVYSTLSSFLNFSQTCFSSRSSVASNSEFPEPALPADAVPWVCASGATVVDKMSDSKRERLQICLAIDPPSNLTGTGAKTSGDSRDLIRNLRFAFRLRSNIPPFASARDLLALVPRPKTRSCAARPLLGPKNHDLPHFEAISRTLLRPPTS